MPGHEFVGEVIDADTRAWVGRRVVGEINLACGRCDWYWLTERYALFAADRRGRIYRGDIHHGPWPLQPAEAEFETNAMTGQIGVTLPKDKPLLHYAEILDVLVWPPEPLNE